MKKILLSLCLLGVQFLGSAQNGTNFRSPMDIPLYLSGNFGELRSDHFHSGIDIKTQGITGHKIYSIEDGYVSRIKVQGGGYGHALYIAHPNGYTSVYGHLSAYSAAISNYTRKVQYDRESFEVDLYLKPGELAVKKGEIVALSGNTGSSAGPHLHFEIRKTSNQHPANALLYHFPIKDDIAPKFSQLIVYPRGDDSQVQQGYKNIVFSVDQSGNSYSLNSKDPVKVFGKIGFGVEVFDYLNGSRNRCGVYNLELKINDQTYFLTEMREFSFSESRFINAHIDYAQKKENRKSIQRLYKMPYNDLSIYKYVNGEGLIDIRDTFVHKVEVIATDTYGNKSDLSFSVKGTGVHQRMSNKKAPVAHLLPFNADGGFTDRDIKLSFPAYSFYEDVPFTYLRTGGLPETESDIFHIHSSATPIHKRVKLSLKPNSDLSNYAEKVCMVAINDDNEIACVGGEYSNGYVTAEVRSFGMYAIAIDTIGPSISALNIQSGKILTGVPGIRFIVKDELSGIASYEAYIDNEWILMQYDPKNELLFYTFDDSRISGDKNHELELYVEDSKGNKAFYHTTFYR
jgi:murein DD-endopeptidase MepM/ murein hydrolase activator NlpD